MRKVIMPADGLQVLMSAAAKTLTLQVMLRELLEAYDADAGEPPPEREDLLARCRKEANS